MNLVAEQLDESQRKALLLDVARATVTTVGDYLAIDLGDYDRPSYIGHRNLPFEGKLKDVRGGTVSAVINIDRNHRLLEVEFIWWENEGGPRWIGPHLKWPREIVTSGDVPSVGFPPEQRWMRRSDFDPLPTLQSCEIQLRWISAANRFGRKVAATNRTCLKLSNRMPL